MWLQFSSLKPCSFQISRIPHTSLNVNSLFSNPFRSARVSYFCKGSDNKYPRRRGTTASVTPARPPAERGSGRSRWWTSERGWAPAPLSTARAVGRLCPPLWPAHLCSGTGQRPEHTYPASTLRFCCNLLSNVVEILPCIYSNSARLFEVPTSSSSTRVRLLSQQLSSCDTQHTGTEHKGLPLPQVNGGLQGGRAQQVGYTSEAHSKLHTWWLIHLPQ